MSDRIVTAYLSDLSHRMPIPDTPRLFPVEGEPVDLWQPWVKMCLADGSLTLRKPEAAVQGEPLSEAASDPEKQPPAPPPETSAPAADTAPDEPDPAPVVPAGPAVLEH